MSKIEYVPRKFSPKSLGLIETANQIEKDALVGVIERVCRKLDVPFFSCRGYTSQSEMWGAAQRLNGYSNEGMQPVIIHLGDHDPSGKDMTRDIGSRLEIFHTDVQVERIALNMDQIRKYNPPPNPAKITEEFGSSSWELDALDPKVLENLIEQKILSYLDEDKWDEQVRKQDKDKAALLKVAKAMK